MYRKAKDKDITVYRYVSMRFFAATSFLVIRTLIRRNMAATKPNKDTRDTTLKEYATGRGISYMNHPYG